MKILVSGYNVELVDEAKMNEIIVDFPGPPDSPYSEVSHLFYRLWSNHFAKFDLLCEGCMESEGDAARLIPA